MRHQDSLACHGELFCGKQPMVWCSCAAGTPALVALLQAVSKSPAAPSVKTTVVTLLASLPWAQEIRAEQAPSVQSLLQLPGAKQVDAGFVLELLVKAVHAELPQVTTQLGRCVNDLSDDPNVVIMHMLQFTMHAPASSWQLTNIRLVPSANDLPACFTF